MKQTTNNIDNPTCFAANTPVWTPDGFKPISAVRAGDEVLAFNYTTGRWLATTVTRVITRRVKEQLAEVITKNDVIHATHDHPFATLCEAQEGRETCEVIASRFANATGVFVQQKTRVQVLKWILAGDLRSGDQLMSRLNDHHEVYACHYIPYQGVVFDLVTKTATYAVGLSQTLVHCRKLI